MASGYDLSSQIPFRLMKGRLGVYDKRPFNPDTNPVEGVEEALVIAGSDKRGTIYGIYELSEQIELDKNIKHNIEIIVDRLVVRPGIEKRMTDSVETVLELAEGLLVVDVIDGEPIQFSQKANS